MRHLLLIGCQRCGTTWLQRALASHPEIVMAEPRRPEPKVFLSAQSVERGREWYERTYFAHAADEPVRAEKSTSYLEDPSVADRAVAMLGDPMILVQLRDPVERALSHWAFSTEHGTETRPLTEVLELNLRGPLPWDGTGPSVSPYAYLERGRYADYLRPWVERFGDDLRVQLLEEMVAEPARIGEAYAWLGVDASFRPDDLHTPENVGSTPTPELPAELHARLRAYYDDSDRDLADLLGRDLPWRPARATT